MGPSRGGFEFPEARFHELYEARPVVERFVRRATHDRSQVSDLVHETFIVAWRRLADVPPGPQAVGWLCGVARRVVLNAERSSRRRAALTERYALAAPVDPVPVPSADFVDAMAAWRRLPACDQSILVLVGWYGADGEELARVLGCTADAAAMRVSRARSRLRTYLAT